MKGLLFTYAMTYGGAAVSIFYPYVGFLIYVCFSIIKPPAMWYWSVPLGNYDRIIAVAVIIGWIIQGTGNWKLGPAATKITLCLVGFFLWGVVGWACSDVPALAEYFVIEQFKILLMFLIGVSLIDTPAKLKTLAWVMAISLGYLAYELNLSYYAGINRVAVDGFAAMDNNCVAVTMATGAGLAVFLGFGEKNLVLKCAALVSAVLMVHVVMFSWSRGGMVALICVGVAAFLLIQRQPKHYLVFLVLLAVSWRLAGNQVVSRFTTVFVDPEERDASANSRVEYWGYCWSSMKRNPVLGVGPGHWFIECGRIGARPIYAHSVWLQTGAELGFPGLALLLGFYGSSVLQLYPLTRPKTKTGDPWFPDAARMVIASLVGFGVAGTFVSLANLEIPYYIVLLGVGVLKVNTRLLDLAGREPVPAPAEDAASPLLAAHT